MDNIDVVYKRVSTFSLESILFQTVDFIKRNHKLPVKILLPPEEYIFINYLSVDFGTLGKKRITEFMDFPLGIHYEPQDKEFDY